LACLSAALQVLELEDEEELLETEKEIEFLKGPTLSLLCRASCLVPG
jgi:hypothetical protein